LCELAHVEPADLFEYLAGRSIKQVVFTHLSQNYREDEQGLRALAADRLEGIPFELAADGQQFSF